MCGSKRPVGVSDGGLKPAIGRRGLSHGAWVLAAGAAGSYGLSFLRNLILARLLTKADFGLAALFSNTLAMLELASRMSFGQQIVQFRDGGSKSFRNSAHAFQLVMATIGAAAILIFSITVAPLLARRDVSWAIASLALVPIAKGFQNLDVFREQRCLNQLPGVLCEFVPQLVVTLAAWPLALWLEDFRVILCILVAKPALGLLMTHLVASEAYGLLWRRDFFRCMATFGWPLVLNGVLIFASQQADQFLVAGFLSAEQLASYALAFSLASVPFAVFASPALSLMLPVLSSVQDQPDALLKRYRSAVEVICVGAVALTLPLIVFGEQIITVLYGAKYAGTGPVVGVLGVATAFKFLRFAPALAAMARGDTRNQLNSNLVRASSLPLAALLLGAGFGATAVAVSALLAEVASGAFSLFGLSRRHAVPLRETTGGAQYIFAFLVLAFALRTAGAQTWNFWHAALGANVLLLFVVSAGCIAFPQTVKPLFRVAVGGIRRLPR